MAISRAALTLLLVACAHEPAPARVALPEVAAVPRPPPPRAPAPAVDPDAPREDARVWSELTDWISKHAGAVEWDKGWFSLARRDFFDDGLATLHAEVAPWLEQIAWAVRELPRGARLVVTLTFEDDPRPAAVKTGIAADRAKALSNALARLDIDASNAEIRSSIKPWEGSYDGPATLDPAEGRVTFAIVR